MSRPLGADVRMLRRHIASLLLLVATLCFGFGARAAPTGPTAASKPTAEQRAEAKRLFRAGARAYRRGNFPTAIQAFEQAREVAPQPALTFSLAQTLKRFYAVDGRSSRLRRALKLYRQYVSEVPEGGRRLDAVRAIGEIQLIFAQLGEEADGISDERAPRSRTHGTLSLDSVLGNAFVAIDGGPRQSVPTFIPLTAGSHRVRITADGYHELERGVLIVAGRIRALDVSLVELPAKLDVHGSDGAEVLIDGRHAGTTPMDAMKLPGGKHLVAVGTTGHVPHVTEVQLERGKAKRIEVDLEVTQQRVAAYSTWVAALAFAGVGAGFAIAVAGEVRAAEDLKADGTTSSPEGALRHNAALERAGDYLIVSGVAFGASALAGTIGLLLFALDPPELREAGGESSPRIPSEPSATTLRLTPWLSPLPTEGGPALVAGGALTGTF